jgi:ASC-1-like (ASCH) protein
MNEPTVHELKILPEWFALQLSGDKRFEVRVDDRNYQVGDTLILNEWDGDSYTGRCITVFITCILGFEELKRLGCIKKNTIILGTSEEIEAVL